MDHLVFADKMPTYQTFLEDLASAIADKLLERQNEPQYISQTQAFKMFGRDNVLRWRRKGLVQPCKRPGKLEYKTAELRRLKERKQDYFV